MNLVLLMLGLNLVIANVSVVLMQNWKKYEQEERIIQFLMSWMRVALNKGEHTYNDPLTFLKSDLFLVGSVGKKKVSQSWESILY